MNQYNPKEIEPKWQAEWEKQGLYKAPSGVTPENKMYILPQLPYPSGQGLHVGHAEVYTACDIYARYQRMMGKKVLQALGWDSFGLPAENYAIKTNVHPRVSTDAAIENFRSQIKSLGISVDWDREIGSHNVDYYKWTQWFFLLMYKQGLAYRKNQNVNWCDSCKTALANEQVTSEGKCERCDTVVVQRPMEQWYLKITDYADKLLEGLDRIDWPEETKMRQRNWIGRSEGAEIDFLVNCHPERSEGSNNEKIKVFTTAHDTIYGVTFMVLAPEHDLVQHLKANIQNWNEVETYIAETKLKTELDRQVQKEKTGLELKGIKAINPVNNQEIPVWIADYVLASYGTGAIMAVPGEDERDYEFAGKYNLPIIYTTQEQEFVHYSEKIKPAPEKYTLANSGEFSGVNFKEGREQILQKLVSMGVGVAKVQYKLRDWSVSRQRFWGAPIPMLHKKRDTKDKPKILLIHGYGGHDQENWFPWFKNEMEQKGYEVFIPNLPHTDEPVLEEWIEALNKLNFKKEDEVYIVAHSLGAPTACKFIEQSNVHVNKLILVAPVGKGSDYKHLSKYDFTADDIARIVKFAEEPINWTKLKASVDSTVLYLSTDDPYIPLEVKSAYKELFPHVQIFTDKHHFNQSAGILQLPEIIKEFPLVNDLCWMPIPEQDLPVILPDDVDFKPTGQSPLMYAESFNAGVEEKYGKGWKREPDTLDTFMCSSWYYYRYLDPKNDTAFASPEVLKKWMPVDFYLGGEEHVNGHLLYARFFTKVLFDAGYITFDEPFTKNRHQGLILGEDNRKMSKRWGNVINPTDVVNEFGADTCRVYEMFMGPLEATKPWSTDSVKGVRRFFDRVWKLQEKVVAQAFRPDRQEIEKIVHLTVKKVSEDLANMQYNTAIAKMMELINAFSKEETISQTHFELLLKILTPFAPHITEEMWANLGHTTSITTESWPHYDASKIVSDTMNIVIQVNGKVRASIEVDTSASEEDIKTLALAQENVQKHLEGKNPQKVIYVKGKLVSIVV